MLIKDPQKRPSMRKTLEREFLAKRISKLLTTTIAKNEFTDTFLKKHIFPLQGISNRNEESKELDTSQNDENSIIQAKQKMISNKEVIKKKKRIEMIGESQDDS